MTVPSRVLVIQARDIKDVSLSTLAVYSTVLRGMTAAGIKIHLVTQHDLQYVDPREYSQVLVPSLSILKQLHLVWKGKAIEYVLTVAPETPPNWGSETDPFYANVGFLSEVTPSLVTESESARRDIESCFSSRMVEVYVVPPDFHSVSTTFTSAGDDALFANRVLSLEDSSGSWSYSSGVQRSNPLNSGLGDWSTLGQYETDIESLPSFSSVLEDERTSTGSARPLNAEELGVAQKVAGDLFGSRSSDDGQIAMAVFGNKLSFIEEMARDYSRLYGAKVTLDPWRYLSGPNDKVRSERLLSESNVVIGEWARPNNVWIQERADDSQRLIVRVHRYEVTTDFPRAIDMDRFDAAVVIVPWVGRVLVQKFGWPAEKLVYIPNYVNARMFDRPKVEGAEFTLGLVGITPSLKRIDLALDLLRELRSVDSRYVLRVRGEVPLHHPHWNSDYRIRRQWGSVKQRLSVDPLLRNAVFFDSPGPDMAAWLQQIGTILSPSDVEGSHVALAEGVASGAIPVVRRWPGASTMWPESAIFDDLPAAVERVLSIRDSATRTSLAAEYKGLDCLNPEKILAAWSDVANGRNDGASRVFGPIDWTVDPFDPVEVR